ncbi:MAG: serine hydrolase [Desulfobulbaceae bacterium]|nr:serine hydrolase [Desulfobulbaceae bacterium]
MNWIGKCFIVVSCFVTFILAPAPSLLAANASAIAAKKKVTTQKTISKRTRRQSKKIVKHHAPVRRKRVAASRCATKQSSRSVALVGANGDLSRRITARSAMVMDARSGEEIYAQAANSPAQPASTIKVLTGVISLNSLRKNELVPVSQHAARMPKSKIYLSVGRKYPADDLINAVLLASANDASVALAEKIGGSEEGFARLMTAKARSFGATNTVCKTANGLTASGQYTTAHDLAKIFNHAMQNDEFASKMAVTEVENTDGKIIKSHNRALWQVDGAEGGKTGYTDAARKTYVGKFKRNNDEIIVSLMGSENMWGDLKKLVEYGFSKKQSAQTALRPKTNPSLPTPRFAKIGKSAQQLSLAETF